MTAAARGTDTVAERGERLPKVGLVGPLPPPEGGMANQTYKLRQLLGRDGVPVEVLRTNSPLRPRALDRVRGVRAVVKLVLHVARLWALAGRVDVLHVLANSGLTWHLVAVPSVLIARLRGRPVIVNYRGGGAQAFFEREWWLVEPVMRRASEIVVPSGFLHDVFSSYGIEAKLIANVVDVERFSRSDYRGVCRAPEIRIVTTRNLEPIYDVETAVRAFALIRREFENAHLTIAGDGPERRRLEEAVREWGLAAHVTFAGRLGPDELAPLLRTARLLLNPSRVDNMPNSLLEALATGIPIVSTNVGGIPNVIDDGVSGFLVPPADPRAMADAALRLLEDEQLAVRMAESAWLASSQYRWDVVGRQWLTTYRAHGRV